MYLADPSYMFDRFLIRRRTAAQCQHSDDTVECLKHRSTIIQNHSHCDEKSLYTENFTHSLPSLSISSVADIQSRIHTTVPEHYKRRHSRTLQNIGEIFWNRLLLYKSLRKRDERERELTCIIPLHPSKFRKNLLLSHWY